MGKQHFQYVQQTEPLSGKEKQQEDKADDQIGFQPKHHFELNSQGTENNLPNLAYRFSIESSN